MNHPILSQLLHEAYKAGRASAVADVLEERRLSGAQVDAERAAYVASVLAPADSFFGVDVGLPGSDMTATAMFSRQDGRLRLHSLEHSEPVAFPGYPPVPEDRKRGEWPAPSLQFSPEELSQIAKRNAPALFFNKLTELEPPCPFCFQRGCNGECHGDDMMGD